MVIAKPPLGIYWFLLRGLSQKTGRYRSQCQCQKIPDRDMDLLRHLLRQLQHKLVHPFFVVVDVVDIDYLLIDLVLTVGEKTNQ